MKITVSTSFDITGLYPVGNFVDANGKTHDYYQAHDAISGKRISVSKDVYDKLAYLARPENRTKENISAFESDLVIKSDKVKLNLASSTPDGFISL